MKRFIPRASIPLVFLFVSAWLGIFFLSTPPLLNGLSFSKAIYDEKHRLLRLTLSKDEKYRLYTPLSQISPMLIETTLLQEDQYFHWHWGVNPFAIIKAAWKTYGVKSRRIGASTISMQVARMRFHINSKTTAGKIWQILRAFQLELHYSKKQILEAYLNLAPYGNNIEGVGAASLIYFNQPAKKIALPDALTLSVIPQNPSQRTPLQKNLNTSRKKLFARWIQQHAEDKNKQAIIDLPLQLHTTRSLPFLAPHFVNSVLQNNSSKQEIVTTLNIELQKTLEQIAKNYLARKKPLGVFNTSIMLIDTRDMSVKALMGSADFFNEKIQGQVNGTQVRRSPGSTLKPFIYGLALDQGLIHPNTVLKDVAHSFGNYNPENFDYDFMGPIKAKDALTLSRNIPAIYLASQLSQNNLYQLLQAAQIKHLKSESYYGLSLVLGGAELTMSELASLYAMLVNNGVWHPLRFYNEEQSVTGNRLLSPEASFLVLDMLKNTSRHHLIKQKLSVSWKTGTSSGFRDAWTIGSFGPYVLAVWIGNFDNSSNKAFVGKSIAAPLFFELTNAISNEYGTLPVLTKNPKELNLTEILVCKASGMLPTPFCKDTELTWFIPGKSPIKSDTIYREITIDNKTGLRTCQINQNTRFEIYEFWPSDLLQIFKSAGMQRRTPPAFDTSCGLTTDGGLIPQITSPRTNLNYVLRTTGDTKIPLTAVADGDVQILHWFINETYLTKIERDKPLLWNAKPGKFIVRVVDDHGRSDAREVIVKVES